MTGTYRYRGRGVYGYPSTPQKEPTVKTATMTVRVRDHAADAAAWGHGSPAPAVRTVTIPAVCPQCAGPRGVPAAHRFHEDGDWVTVDTWSNPCGHVDMYVSVLAEADAAAQTSSEATS